MNARFPKARKGKGARWPIGWSGARLRRSHEGKWGYILAWLVGIPVPILLGIYLLRGCT